MNSVRERLVREVLTRLTVRLHPLPVLRMPGTPLPRDLGGALLLLIEGDQITAHANQVVSRALTLRLTAVCRGPEAFDIADQTLVAAHAALLADPSLGGLALGLREIDCEWEFDDTDTGAAALPARFEIRYRTHAHDLTKTG